MVGLVHCTSTKRYAKAAARCIPQHSSTRRFATSVLLASPTTGWLSSSSSVTIFALWSTARCTNDLWLMIFGQASHNEANDMYSVLLQNPKPGAVLPSSSSFRSIVGPAVINLHPYACLWKIECVQILERPHEPPSDSATHCYTISRVTSTQDRPQLVPADFTSRLGPAASTLAASVPIT